MTGEFTRKWGGTSSQSPGSVRTFAALERGAGTHTCGRCALDTEDVCRNPFDVFLKSGSGVGCPSSPCSHLRLGKSPLIPCTLFPEVFLYLCHPVPAAEAQGLSSGWYVLLGD